jgi:hypothetical protein
MYLMNCWRCFTFISGFLSNAFSKRYFYPSYFVSIVFHVTQVSIIWRWAYCLIFYTHRRWFFYFAISMISFDKRHYGQCAMDCCFRKTSPTAWTDDGVWITVCWIPECSIQSIYKGRRVAFWWEYFVFLHSPIKSGIKFIYSTYVSYKYYNLSEFSFTFCVERLDDRLFFRHD